MDETLDQISFYEFITLGGTTRGPKLHLGVGWFFEPWPVITLKSSHLSNEGSNFILSLLEVGHWAAQTWLFFHNLPENTDFGLLQQS